MGSEICALIGAVASENADGATWQRGERASHLTATRVLS